MKGLDAHPWNILWDDFLSEARRFDGRKLSALFGDAEPVRNPPNKLIDLSKRDRLLIGEFLRRNHARLAHEIALNGVPGVNGQPYMVIDAKTETARELSDIAGVVARSHGMPLRSALFYVGKKYHVREFKQIHAAFLMVLLRISDYFQIQAKRAPCEVLEVRRLSSRISAVEWKVHAAIRNITPADDDPEAIFIDANPLDVHSFLRIRDWVCGIQSELDTSWAVLGEVYGRFQLQHLDELKLRLRRIHSNLDNLEEFSKTRTYVPARVAFETADPDLLKLLVGPLYGDNPAVGLRELIQNAVDAVRELQQLRAERTGVAVGELRDLPADVVVEIGCNEDDLPTTITVTDRGIGMSAETVREYFLKAGASFRKSDAWRKAFEDDQGNSSVLRSGRFGVGALATFLIGDRIEVISRHVECPRDQAVKFEAGLDDSVISLEWTSAPIGTQIRVAVPPERREHVKSALGYGYFVTDRSDPMVDFSSGIGQYFASTPQLSRIILTVKHGSVVVRDAQALPAENDSAPHPWRQFRCAEYSNVFWTYGSYRTSFGGIRGYPRLSCNGIVVDHSSSFSYPYPPPPSEYFISQYLVAPALCIYDRNGRLPLNLERTGLARRDDDLFEHVARAVTDDLIAYALVNGPPASELDQSATSFLTGSYRGLSKRTYGRMNYSSPWFFTNNGFGFLDRHLVRLSNSQKIVIIYPDLSQYHGFAEIVEGLRHVLPDGAHLVICASAGGQQINAQKFLYRSLLEVKDGLLVAVPDALSDTSGYAVRTRTTGGATFLQVKKLQALVKKRKVGKTLKKAIREGLRGGEVEGAWLRRTHGDHARASKSKLENDLLSIAHSLRIEAFAVCDLPPTIHARDTLVEQWQARLGDGVIPYDIERRRNKFSAIFKELSQYVANWERDILERNKKNKSTENDDCGDVADDAVSASILLTDLHHLQ